ncbi:hypothetical protein V1520DRAFT_393420 [Lipomyces starkeyi]|uniref:Uncharacterized protein n=1 Tax=Lipomyces starkeyi NRRL Y-11557 TaxID=675824 RepID=A0A1E3PU75_LIPST|nr:hypothetical protein LIPSTDRAFT_76610 [Lipomyces starkeyi NRRL Y-11557]
MTYDSTTLDVIFLITLFAVSLKPRLENMNSGPSNQSAYGAKGYSLHLRMITLAMSIRRYLNHCPLARTS